MTPYEYVKGLFKASKPELDAGKQMHTAFSSVLTLLLAGLIAFGFTTPTASIESALKTLVLIGALWFVFTLLFVAPYKLLDAAHSSIKELAETLADKKEKKRIAHLLSAQMMKGRDFMAQCTYPETRGEVKDAAVDAWASETEAIIRKELGPVYFALFNTPDGMAPIDLLEDKSRNMTWNGIRFRVTNLRNMILDFSKP